MTVKRHVFSETYIAFKILYTLICTTFDAVSFKEVRNRTAVECHHNVIQLFVNDTNFISQKFTFSLVKPPKSQS